MSSILDYITNTLISLDILVVEKRLKKKRRSKTQQNKIKLIDLTSKDKSIK